MTPKRFVKFNITANDDCTILNGVKDTVTGEWYHTIDNENAKRLCGLLNELHEEKQSVIDWIDKKIGEIKPYNSELCRATLLELKEYLE